MSCLFPEEKKRMIKVLTARDFNAKPSRLTSSESIGLCFRPPDVNFDFRLTPSSCNLMVKLSEESVTHALWTGLLALLYRIHETDRLLLNILTFIYDIPNMEHPICVVDAATLVDRIHEIKQWVYDDAIRIHVPLSTFEKVEQLYQASLAPKEPQKESAPKKTSSKATRKEIPLFDINPRTAKEFLVRAQGAHLNNISFQLPHEQFTQWKEEEQQATKIEQAPEGPPTSFAEALRRKKFNDELESNGSKGPSKPKLVARSSSPKSPWKYHKVPIIASSEVSQAMKPFFSCMLWRLHEFENNPLMPESFVLLSNDNGTRIIAQKLGIPTKDTYEIRQAIKSEQAGKDTRATVGELEREFPPKKSAENGIHNSNRHQHDPASAPSNGFDFEVEAILEQDEEIEELKKTIIEKVINGTPEIAVSSIDLTSDRDAVAPEEMVVLSKPEPFPTPEVISTTLFDSGIDELETETKKLLTNDSAEIKESLSSQNKETDLAKLSENLEAEELLSTISQSPHHEKKSDIIDTNEESDDDEEVVVFKPKSRRFSGLPKASTEPSRPKTADATNGISENHASPSPLKPHITTQLKPQSPVFVPKSEQRLVDTTVQPPKEATVNATVPAPIHTQNVSRPPTQPQKRVHKPHNPRSEGLAQRHSREIIERQREVINRQVQVPAKPPPRQIKLQPTSSPTVIDPDAFDRSYVVQTPSVVPNITNGNHRAQSGRGSPRRAPRTPEPEVDFVLKSGSPRGSTRGRGKLWVP
ncbi:hypothetical protein MMC18_003505 [Xylographa bjoerkii]|nr:hypothetical protein [Xylographa bjoerkii]